MTHDDPDIGPATPSASDADSELLREMLDLVDERVSRISDEEVEARLRLVLARVNEPATSPILFPSAEKELQRCNPAIVDAHIEAIRIVEVARRESDARRREAHYAERHLAHVKKELEKAVEAARANAEITENRALGIIEHARERANWILDAAERVRDRTAQEEAVAAAGSSRGSNPPVKSSRAHYEAGPGSPARSPESSIRVAEPNFAYSSVEKSNHRLGWRRRYARLLLGYDALVAVVTTSSAYLLRFPEGLLSWAHGYALATVAGPLLWVGAIALSGGYEARVFGLGSEEFQRIFRAFVGLTATIGLVSYALKADIARGYLVWALPLALVLSFFGHYVFRKRLHRGRARGRYSSRVIAVGAEEPVADLTSQLEQDRYSGMQVVGACLSSGDGARLVGLGVPLLGGLDDVVQAVKVYGADTVAVAAGASVGPARLRRLCWQLEGTDTDLVVAPGLMEVAGPRLHIRPMTGLPLLHVEEPEFAGTRRLIKGVVDRVLATVAFLLTLPLLAVIWVAVRLSSPGPAIFKQVRTGQDGKEFMLLKFRSMYVDADQRRAELLQRNERSEGLLFKIRNDPRITPVGRFLRRLSLDELPQLINVMQGKMSLVGPRPPLPEEVALYQDDVRRRLLVKPGLTGLWQISGRSDLDWDESVRLDLRYVENWSFTLDLMILWKTMSAVVRGRGAY